jgi:hypothetical protein
MAEALAIIQWQDGSEERFFGESSVHTPHLASVLLELGAYQDTQDLETAIQRAFQICLQLRIPITRNFQPIHVYDDRGEVESDWALSDLAFYLLLLNGNAQNPDVAHAQAWALRKTMGW